jgi:HK97 family phage portal protein
MSDTNGTSRLLDHTGRPMAMKTDVARVPRRRVKGMRSSFHSDFNSWISSLSNTKMPPHVRAADPFHNHAWVFAAAMTTATVASQAPFTIMRETDEALEERKRLHLKRYGSWQGPRRGSKRKALLRHIMRSRAHRIRRKGLEPDFDHPITDVMISPNPYQTGIQMWQMTHLWMAIRGEVFWVLEQENGEPLIGDELPDRIWPLSPDLFEPILEHGSHGPLIGWDFYVPRWMEKRSQGYKLHLPLTDVIQFKFPNPTNPLRGLSKIGAVAMGIEMDMLVKEYNKRIIENGGDPGGIILYDADLSKEEEQEYIGKWEERHQGSTNARRTAMLSGGFKYQPLALSPKDMEWLASQEWDREEILAAMNVPRSVLGVPDQTYATQLGQDANFWDKNLLPLLQLEEQTLEASSLFFTQPDDVVGLFDITDIEALRAGTADKVKIAIDLSGDVLHAPPEVAFDVVGLDIEEYEGSDISLVKPALTTVDDVIESASEPDLPPVEPAPPPSPTQEPGGEPVTPEEPVVPDEAAAATIVTPGMAGWRSERRERAITKDFDDTEQMLEDLMKPRYRQWVGGERSLHLTAFDSVEAALKMNYWSKLGPQDSGKYIAALPPLDSTKLRLKKKVRPLYPQTLESTVEMTMEELGGVPVFQIDDPVFQEIIENRQNTFVNATPETLRKNLIQQIVAATNAGEDVQALRTRIAQVFDISASSGKTLQVARTETASLMNEVRDEIFDAQGITIIAWSTSRDEIVRDTHVIYGNSGDHEQGFNFLTLTKKEEHGTLARPGDTRCTDVSELANCRCKKSAKK